MKKTGIVLLVLGGLAILGSMNRGDLSAGGIALIIIGFMLVIVAASRKEKEEKKKKWEQEKPKNE
ncbi:MAG: hypothetical protein FWF53_10420 [Candidatus Azobacteroides sp.]|nr:hypothetical protein [Candidatus Azobacteroides sp.]